MRKFTLLGVGKIGEEPLTLQKRKRLKRAGVGVLVLFALMLIWDFLPYSRKIEQQTLDFRYANFNRNAYPSEDIVVIEIDEPTLKSFAPTYGRWPWPRKVHKSLIEFLTKGEPAAILFDILFTEAQAGTDDDTLLAEAAANSQIVSSAMQFLADSSKDNTDHVELPLQIGEKFGVNWRTVPPETYNSPLVYHDYNLPNEQLLLKTPRLHSVNTVKDDDGIFRRMPELIKYDKIYLPTLSLRAVLSKVQEPKLELQNYLLKVYEGDKLKWRIPLDKNEMLPLHFYPDKNRPKTIPFGSVLESAIALESGKVEDPSQLAVNPLEFQGKIILVGASATGLEDLKATPVSVSYPGVLLHTTSISNILKQEFLTYSPNWIKYIAALLFIIMSYFAVFFLDSFVLKGIVTIFVFGGYAFLSIWAFKNNNYALNMSIPLGFGLASLLESFIYMSFVEGRERKKITGTLSKYLSPVVTQHLVDNGVDPSAEVGQSKVLSILFSDVRGFTTLSEQLDAAFVVKLLNEYLGKMTDLVFAHEGTLDKFIGDAVMAFWGAPLEQPDHAYRAVKAGLVMLKELENINRSWKEKGYPPIKIGIGINTGSVIVGNIGSEKRLDYTVIGDNVNTASRFEGLTKQYHTAFIIGEMTNEMVKDKCLTRCLDLVKAKGKTNAVKIYEPMCEKEDPNFSHYHSVAERFNAAWNLYYKGDFKSALKGFEDLNLTVPNGDGPSEVYIERCRELIEEPPQTWEGVFVAKSK